MFFPASKPAMVPTVDGSAQRLLRHGERWQLAIGVVAVLLCAVVVGGYLTAVRINNARYPPDKPVLEFFAALAAGDSAGAARLAGCATPSCAAAMAAHYRPPSQVRIIGVRYGGAGARRGDASVATVEVAYRLAGTGDHAARITVERSGTLLKRPFRIVSGASGQVVPTAPNADRVYLGALDVQVADEQRSSLRAGQPIRLLPGSYSVRLRDDDPLLAATGDQVLVDVAAGPDDLAQPLPIRMQVQVRDSIIAAVNTQVEQTLTACARQRVVKPLGCSFQIPGVVIGARQVQWAVQQLPQVRVDVPDEPTVGTRKAVIRTVVPGRVQVTYSAFTSASGQRRQFVDELPVRVRGDITVEPGAAPTISIS